MQLFSGSPYAEWSRPANKYNISLQKLLHNLGPTPIMSTVHLKEAFSCNSLLKMTSPYFKHISFFPQLAGQLYHFDKYGQGEEITLFLNCLNKLST